MTDILKIIAEILKENGLHVKIYPGGSLSSTFNYNTCLEINRTHQLHTQDPRINDDQIIIYTYAKHKIYDLSDPQIFQKITKDINKFAKTQERLKAKELKNV